MKHNSLLPMFKPQSIAIIGASDDPTKIGGRPIHYLLTTGYIGKIYPINPKYKTIQGLQAYKTFNDISDPIDLLIVAVSAQMVPSCLQDAANAGVKSAIIFSAGFAEVGEAGQTMQREITRIARDSGMRVLGPNCLGLLNTKNKTYCTFSAGFDSGFLKEGRISFVTQSGAFGSHVFTLARNRGIGISSWVATGNEADVKVSDCIAYFAEDLETDVIGVYMEGCDNGIELMDALDLARKHGKPVVMLKVGRSSVGAKAIASHTAALVGQDHVYDTVFKQKGVYRVESVQDFLDIAYAFSYKIFPDNNRVAVLTVSGGNGILMADQLTERMMQLPEPFPEIKQKLLDILPYAAPNNPIDTTAQLINEPALMGNFMEEVMASGQYDVVISFLAHLGLSDILVDKLLEPMRKAHQSFPQIPILVCTITNSKTKQMFEQCGLLVFEDPTQTVKVAEALVKMGCLQLQREHVEPDIPSYTPPQLSIFQNDNDVLTENESKNVLALYGFDVTREILTWSEEESIHAAQLIGYPLVLKGMSPQILHKTDAGLVALEVGNEQMVRRVFHNMKEKISAVEGAQFAGVLVQEMLKPGMELIVGAKRDPVFGPIVMVGLGGIYAELLNDFSTRLAPVSLDEAKEMIMELKGARLLLGLRGKPAADVDALADVISKTSRIITFHPEIEEMDINPVVVYAEGNGAKACDALIKIKTVQFDIQTSC